MNVESIRQESAKAYDLLLFCSMFHNENIPQNVLKAYFKDDILELNKALKVLLNHSVIQIKTLVRGEDNLYSMHEIQKAYLLSSIRDVEYKQYLTSAIATLNGTIHNSLDKFVLLFTSKPYVLDHINMLIDEADVMNVNANDLIELHIKKIEYLLGEAKQIVQAELQRAHKLVDSLKGIDNLTKVRFTIVKARYLCIYEYNDSNTVEFKTALKLLKNYPQAYEELLLVYKLTTAE